MKSSRRAFPLVPFIVGASLLVVSAEGAEPDPLRFSAAGNEFVFNTGVLKGKLREGGKSKGLSAVTHLPSGQTLDRSMGLAGHYRVFTQNRRYGAGAWDWPSLATLEKNGSVRVNWPSAPERPFELQAIYRWASPTALDVETRVTARTNLLNFESFFACYLNPSFTNSLVWCREGGLEAKPAFVSAEPERGLWLAFPRDEQAATMIKDGRWTIAPSPVNWVIMPRLAAPLGFRRAPASGLSVILMSSPDEAFAVMTPNRAEGHYSMYLSLLGRDIAAGESARARARLAFVSNESEAQIAGLYETYLKELEAAK